MRHPFYSFLTAVRFLTVIPLTIFSDKDRDYFIDSVRFFVLVGLLIGCFNLLLTNILISIIPAHLLCCLLMLSLSSVSGFLHMDGLADTADGFFSSRPRDKVLEIMHDSRTGAMGIVVIFFILLFKYTSLISIPQSNLAQVVLLMPVAGRASIVLSMLLMPYARKEGGLGSLFYAEKGWAVPFYSILYFFLSAFFVNFEFLFIAALAVVFSTLLFSFWCRKKIGGATGDTLGAVCEVTETAVVFALAVYVNL